MSINERPPMRADRHRPSLLFAAAILTVSTLGCDAAQGEDATAEVLAIGMIIARDAAEAALFGELDPNEYRDCPVQQDLPTVEWTRAMGDPSQLWVDPASLFEIRSRPIELLLSRIPESDPMRDPDLEPRSNHDRTHGPSKPGKKPSFVFVRARFAEEDQQRIADFRTRHSSCRILISVNGVSSWHSVNRSDWSEWIPLGVFETSSSGYIALANPSWKTRWTEWSELNDSLEAAHRSRDRALRMLACDIEFRAAFERDNPGAIDLLTETMAQIDCSRP